MTLWPAVEETRAYEAHRSTRDSRTQGVNPSPPHSPQHLNYFIASGAVVAGNLLHTEAHVREHKGFSSGKAHARFSFPRGPGTKDVDARDACLGLRGAASGVGSISPPGGPGPRLVRCLSCDSLFLAVLPSCGGGPPGSARGRQTLN